MRVFTLAAVAGLMVLVCSFSESASAQKAGKKNKGGTAQIINELEGVRTLLNKANHDYKGHRAAAVHQVTHAIHLLQHGKHHPNPGQHFNAAKGGNNEPQSVSDAQLQTAIARLNVIAAQVQSAPHAHQMQVLTALGKAVSDLQAALKVA